MSELKPGDTVKIKSIKSMRNTERMGLCPFTKTMSLVFHGRNDCDWIANNSVLTRISGCVTKLVGYNSVRDRERYLTDEAQRSYVSNQIVEELCLTQQNPN